VDTTVQEKAIAHPTDARLAHRAHFADGEQRFHAMVSMYFARS